MTIARRRAGPSRRIGRRSCADVSALGERKGFRATVLDLIPEKARASQVGHDTHRGRRNAYGFLSRKPGVSSADPHLAILTGRAPPHFVRFRFCDSRSTIASISSSSRRTAASILFARGRRGQNVNRWKPRCATHIHGIVSMPERASRTRTRTWP